MKKFVQLRKGFTLIELLVVIAIIGILASVVLVNLNVARQRARNAQRISDIDQVKLALQLYFDDLGTYPAEDAANTIPLALVTANYLPKVPVAPAGTVTVAGYKYDQLSTTTYCLGVYLEGATVVVPGNDIVCDPDGAAGAFDGSAANTVAYTVTQQ